MKKIILFLLLILSSISFSAKKLYVGTNAEFNLTGKKSPTSIGGAMNCPIVF